ncbi:MAG: tagatose-bisphosphate aldolase [Candidatus Nealsonbacteria bacterium CG23_combo_of_CG06-09_8_20_14_all_40_13]|uniref:Tagatose-bisphosphate aldolase n=1 Tax=Candidatus Nealsonbacteria bacterium CG23_combo_of_CG06-09_8_20_14_all_40_13 TaxID=1974724 RepID=A0A2G9YRM8_9BACT|nr:MAG: tagatose-bisphosphate aldolase [Candidatus Nealsonbacteria bacterium CG23_combo_of_CG06-09_8_20_14_all_40_13]PIR70746.1 MAG: tagatose-bisphosphate aldolase [Candidatus Nealsonbacteria bacterium CG10_big_fil_rev_8_21_14_0_10_40_24]PIU43234.1 MAG: tagatose-bisphosphate aldolase [Candidatus Nealsonbacteria bacterium CG07_land_8_20_14_0_80_40_10]
MLVSSKDLILQARKKKYAIGSFNFSNLETLKAIISAGEKLKSPLIVSTTEKAIAYAKVEYLSALAQKAAAQSPLPIVLNLDHGKSLETVSLCLENGYTSVMIDSSHLPFKNNITITKQVVELAHRQNVPVEGELGELGTQSFTDVSQVRQFVEQTGVDFLAVALGSAHGVQKEEHLNLEILEEITKQTTIPLVLHGGSGLPDEDIKQAIRKGICKINIDTDIRTAFKQGLKEGLAKDESDFREILKFSIEDMIKVVEDKIKLFGSENKA